MGNWSKYQTGKPDVTDEYQSSIDLIADRIDNNENGLNGDDALTSIDINGGAIDGTPIGASSESTGNFSTVTASSATITTAEITNLVTSGTADIFGTWDNSTYSVATNYQASTDGFVMAYFTPLGSFCGLSIYTDSSDTPSALRARSHGNSGVTLYVITPVKKSDYFRIEAVCSTSITINWLPIGS